MSESTHGMWSSRLMFVLGAAGSAIGLGNIWRFPYVAGEFAGWFLDRRVLAEQLEGAPKIVIKLLRVLVRVVAPVCIFVMFVMNLWVNGFL